MSHALIPMNGEVHDHQFDNPFANHIQLSSSTLGIIYSLVARGGVILAHHACCHGNFTEVAQQVLRSVVRETDCRLSYAAGEWVGKGVGMPRGDSVFTTGTCIIMWVRKVSSISASLMMWVSCIHTWRYVCDLSLLLCFRNLKGQRHFSFWKTSETGELRST